ncbi:PD-(D/E)XK nuclease family protein [Candidatus Woesebacteria bacterium]|nr:PD-(D/E)XK nuclease family protein [Candidatus Woesebacteria bacterium]
MESIVIPGTELYLKGKYDLLVKRRDGTYLLVDFKLSQPHVDKIDKYKTQLYSYKFAMEHPRHDEPIRITQMGLIVMYPDQVKFDNGVATLTFPPKWLEVPIDESSFTKFMDEINTLITGPIPNENEDCRFCKYRHVNERYRNTKSDLPF